MRIIDIRAAMKELRDMNTEIRYKSCIEQKRFSMGLIAFRPRKNRDLKQIRHPDKDVVCQVVRGHGRLRVKGRSIALKPGRICHIPKGTRHDFVAGKKGDLLLFYSLIKTG